MEFPPFERLIKSPALAADDFRMQQRISIGLGEPIATAHARQVFIQWHRPMYFGRVAEDSELVFPMRLVSRMIEVQVVRMQNLVAFVQDIQARQCASVDIQAGHHCNDVLQSRYHCFGRQLIGIAEKNILALAERFHVISLFSKIELKRTLKKSDRHGRFVTANGLHAFRI